MTKSRPSASRLRLSKLFRWLAVLCFVKLTIFGLLLLDVPLPFVGDDARKDSTVAENSFAPAVEKQNQDSTKTFAPGEQASPEKAVEAALQHALRTSEGGRLPNVADVVDNPVLSSVAPLPDVHAPQGKAAAKLAEKKQPEHAGNKTQAALPASSAVASSEQVFKPADLPLPAPLPAPVADPGVMAPRMANPVPQADNEGVWDMLGLTKLPIPTLGSVKTAHAAAQSMPLPQAAPASEQSPFAPQEQRAPLVMPGAPDIPANIPTGQQLGEPLPPRGMSAAPAGGIPAGAMPPMPGGTANPGQMGSRGGDNLYDAQELARQQQDVLMLKQQMDERLKELRTSEQRVQKMLEEARGLEEKKLKSLILMYVNMKPKTAAQAIEKMDDRVAAQILKGMTPKQSGEILSYTNPQVTAKLTELLSRMRVQ